MVSDEILDLAQKVVDAEMNYRKESYPGLNGGRRQELEATRSHYLDLLDNALRTSKTSRWSCRNCACSLSGESDAPLCVQGGTCEAVERSSSKATEVDAEQLRVQLAGCGVAALGGIGTRCDVAKRGDYGWSQSYQDVLELREKYEALVVAAKSAVHSARPTGTYDHLVGMDKLGDLLDAAESNVAPCMEGPTPVGDVPDCAACEVEEAIGGNHFDRKHTCERQRSDNARAACRNCDGRGYHENAHYERDTCPVCLGSGDDEEGGMTAHRLSNTQEKT